MSRIHAMSGTNLLQFPMQSVWVWGSGLLFELVPLILGFYYGGCLDGTTWGMLVGSPTIVYTKGELIATQLGIYTLPLLATIVVSIVLTVYLLYFTIPEASVSPVLRRA